MKEYMEKLFCYVLAGGKGRRLQNLTKDTCKPLIKICSHYHLIDFTITNCLNSEIRNMAIVAQYDTMDLIEHLLSSNLRSLSNFHILTPETRRDIEQGIEFQNTAHSVHVNTKVVGDNMEDILIVSADHVYSMDYTKFYKKHLDAGNDLTVSVFEVPYERASHFGVFEVDEDDNIISFEEKPENPKSNLISMGVYLFKKRKNYLKH